MGVVNVQQGRGASVVGLPDIQRRLKAIMDAGVGAEAEAVIADAARGVLTQVRNGAEAVRVPHEVLQDIFIYTRQPGGAGKRDSLTALVGIRKLGRSKDARAYVTWRPGRQVGKFEKKPRSRKKGGSLVVPGMAAKIGENLGTMWEFGTTKMQPRPWFRPALQQARAGVLNALVNGYKSIIERHAA